MGKMQEEQGAKNSVLDVWSLRSRLRRTKNWQLEMANRGPWEHWQELFSGRTGKKSLTEVIFNQGKVVVAASFKNLTKFPHKNVQSNFKGKSKSTGNIFNKTRWKGIYFHKPQTAVGGVTPLSVALLYRHRISSCAEVTRGDGGRGKKGGSDSPESQGIQKSPKNTCPLTPPESLLTEQNLSKWRWETTSETWSRFLRLQFTGK